MSQEPDRDRAGATREPTVHEEWQRFVARIPPAWRGQLGAAAVYLGIGLLMTVLYASTDAGQGASFGRDPRDATLLWMPLVWPIYIPSILIGILKPGYRD